LSRFRFRGLRVFGTHKAGNHSARTRKGKQEDEIWLENRWDLDVGGARRIQRFRDGGERSA
jgi:hypothetical protein